MQSQWDAGIDKCPRFGTVETATAVVGSALKARFRGNLEKQDDWGWLDQAEQTPRRPADLSRTS
jgi:hypothetical protein